MQPSRASSSQRRAPRAVRALTVLAVAQFLLAAAVLWHSGAPGVFGGDFIAYDAAAHQVVARGWQHLYELTLQGQFQQSLLARSGLPAGHPQMIPFNYPPPAALLFLPFALLTPRLAVGVWVALNLALALAAAGMAQRAGTRAVVGAGGRLLGMRPFLALAFLPLDWGLLAGQPVGLLLLVGTGAFLALVRRQDGWAGVCIALLAAVKPQLAVAPALALLALRRGRAVAALVLSGAALLALSLLLVGTAGLLDYFHLLGQMDSFQGNAQLAVHAEVMTNWRAWLLRWPGIAPSLGFWLAAALDVLTLGLAFLALARRRGAEGNLPSTYLALTAAGILASYHSHFQDLTLLLAPALYLLPSMVTRRGAADAVTTFASPETLGLPVAAPGGATVCVAPGSADAGPPIWRPLRWRVPRLLLALALLLLGVPCVLWLVLGALALAWLPLWASLAAPALACLMLLPYLPRGFEAWEPVR